MTWAWMVLGLAVQWGMILMWPRRIGKGLVTKKMWRWPLIGSSLPTTVRSKQVFSLIAVFWTIQFGVADTIYGVAGFWVALIGLYLDDYLFGDDEGKRRWDWVRNKIRWKMALPEPAPQKDTA